MEYYRRFPAAILHLRVRSIVLLTRPPLALAGPYDLHALATPPAFNLSQDQTLQLFFVDPPPHHLVGGASGAIFKRRICLINTPYVLPLGEAHGAGHVLPSHSRGLAGRALRRLI